MHQKRAFVWFCKTVRTEGSDRDRRLSKHNDRETRVDRKGLGQIQILLSRDSQYSCDIENS